MKHEYIVVEQSELIDLEKKVSKYLNDGFDLAGSLVVFHDPVIKLSFYLQSLVRHR